MNTEKKKQSIFSLIMRSSLYVLLSLILLILILVVLQWQTGLLTNIALDYLNSKLENGQIQYAELNGTLLTNLEIEDASFHLDDRLNIQAEKIRMEYSLFALIGGKIKAEQIHIHNMNIQLRSESDSTSIPDRKLSIDTTLTNIAGILLPDSLYAMLPEMDIENIRITINKLKINDQDQWEDLQLDVSQFKNIEGEALITVEKLSGSWIPKQLTISDINFELKANKDRFIINRLAIHTKESAAHLGFMVSRERDLPVFNLEIFELSLELAEFKEVIEINELRRGQINGKMSLSGNPNKFGISTELFAETVNYSFGQFETALTYHNGFLNIDRCEVQSQGGYLNLTGFVELGSEADIKLRFNNLQVEKYIDLPLQTNLNGEIIFDIQKLDLKNLTGSGKLGLYNCMIDSIPVDTLSLNLKAVAGHFEVLKPSFLKLAKKSRFDLQGTINKDYKLDLFLTTFDNRIGAITKAFGVQEIDGSFDGHLLATGALADPDISGNLFIPELKIRTNELDSINLNLYLEKMFSSRLGEAEFEIVEGMISTYPIHNASAKVLFDSNFVDITEVSFVSEENYIDSKMSIEVKEEETLFTASHLKIVYGSYWLENDGPLVVRLDSAGAMVESFNLEGPSNSMLEISGFWEDAIRDLQVAMFIDRVRLEPFKQFWGDELQIKGKIDGTAELINPVREPNLDIDLNVKDLVYNDVKLGDVSGRFQYADDVFYINELNLGLENTSLSADGDLAFNFSEDTTATIDFLGQSKADFRIKWNNINLATFAPLFKLKRPLLGTASGYLETIGTVSKPIIRHHLNLDNLQYGQHTVDSLNLFAQYNSGYIILDSLAASYNGTSFSAKGWQKYDLNISQIDTNIFDKPIRLYLTSKDNKLDFLSNLNDQIETINGDYELELHIGGTLQSPSIDNGSFKLSDGEFIFSRIKDPVRNVQIDATIENSVLKFDQFTAYSVREKDFWEEAWRMVKSVLPWTEQTLNEGQLDVTGTIDLSNVLRPRYDLDIQLEDFYIDYFVENTSMVLATDYLRVSGRDTIKIDGSIYIPIGNYEVNLDQMRKNLNLNAPKVVKKPPFTAMNLNLKFPGNFSISSSPTDLLNNFRIMIAGELNLLKEANSDNNLISGYLETVSGYYTFWNQNFNIEQGSIDFIDPVKLNPEINMVVNKRAGDRIFELTVNGRMDKLQQEMRVLENGREINLSYSDKLALLTLGLDANQVQTNTNSALSNMGGEALTTSILGLVERQAESYTGLDKIKIDANESLFDFQKGRLNNGLQDASISFGKYLTSDLYIEYRTQFNSEIPAPKLSWDAGNRIELEYRVNRFWTLNSFYEKTVQGNNKVEIGLDWEYTF